jgi:hypothetical protein
MEFSQTKAQLKFLANLDEPLVYIPSKGGGDATGHVGNFTMQEVDVYNGRIEKPNSCLDVEGFKFIRQKTEVRDFYNDSEIQTTYHDEIRSLLLAITGATRVEIFDDTRRSSSLSTQKERNVRDPADIVHNDYTARSGVKRLQDYFADDPDQAASVLQRRFAIINVWRSIAGPIQNFPLVLCDASTVEPEDLVSVERRAENRIGELQVAMQKPTQRWYYYPEMRMDEALLLKTFDSETDGRTRFTIHSSFDDIAAPRDAAPRESLETRCFAIF